MLKLAFLCWLLATIAPGAALIRLLWPRAGVLRTIACAPPVSFGVLYAVGLASSRTSLAPASAVLWVSAVLVIGVLALEIYRHRHDRPWRTFRLRRLAPTEAVSWVLLAGAVLLGVYQWRRFASTMLVPVGWDAMHHGLFTAQILRFHTMNPGQILSSDVVGSRDGAKTFYPLAFNLVSAAIHSATGIRISAVLLMSTPAIAGVLAPIGVFALAREIDGRRHLVAGLSAVAATLPIFLYTIVTTGRITGTLAVSLVPACALVLVALRDHLGRHLGWRSGVLAVAALTGMLGLHTSEMPTAVLLAVALSVAVWWREGRLRDIWRWLVWLAVAGVVVAGLAILLEPTVLNLVTQRNNEIAPPVPRSSSEALRSTVVSAASWFPLLALGCLAALLPRWRAYLGNVVMLLLAAVIYFFIAEGDGGVWSTLAIPWYGEPGRMSWDLMALGVIPTGLGLAALADAVGFTVRRVARWVTSPVGQRAEPRWRAVAVSWTGPALGVIATLVLILAFALPPVVSKGRLISQAAGPVDANSLAAFRFLAAHVGPDQHVLDDYRSDGAMWMYVDYGVAPLFGNSPLSGQHPGPWQEKLWLSRHLNAIDRDPCVRSVMNQFSVQYVYVGDRHMIDGWADFSSARMAHDPAFDEVFSAGDAHVFKVVGGALGQCTKNLANYR